jgi:hypothetical protein
VNPIARADSIRVSLAGIAAALACGHAAAQVSFQTVLLSGGEAPGTDPGTLVTYTRALGMGDNGHVVIGADTRVFGGPIVSVAYMGRPDALTIWYRTGDEAGLEPGVTFTGIPGIGRITSGGGTIAFARVQGPGVEAYNSRTVYVVQPNGTMQLALRDAQAAPQVGDGTGVEFGSLNPLVDYYLGTNTFTIADDLRFVKPVRVGGSSVLYGGLAADPHIQIRDGGPAPGIAGATVTQLTVASDAQPRVAGAGKIVLRGAISGPGVDATNNEVFWGGALDALQVLLRKGASVPGMHPGNQATFSGDVGLWTSINESGQTLLWSRLVPGIGDTTGFNDGVLLSGTPGSLSAVLRKGDQVPGLPIGVVYDQVSYHRIGAGGVIGFVTSLAGLNVSAANVNDSAILTGTPGALTVRVREGDHVPGMPPSFTYGDFSSVYTNYLFFNRLGAFVALVAFRDSTTDTTGAAIIYAPPGEGPPTVVLTNTDSIEVAAGDLRTFYRARPVGLSDSGQILINVQFDEDAESTGVFIATVGGSGACCSGTACSSVPQAQCAGAFQGNGTVCGPAGNPTTCCPANYNVQSGLEVQDIFDFLNAWLAGNQQADFNGGGLAVQDIFDFLNAWFAGC